MLHAPIGRGPLYMPGMPLASQAPLACCKGHDDCLDEAHEDEAAVARLQLEPPPQRSAQQRTAGPRVAAHTGRGTMLMHSCSLGQRVRQSSGAAAARQPGMARGQLSCQQSAPPRPASAFCGLAGLAQVPMRKEAAS